MKSLCFLGFLLITAFPSFGENKVAGIEIMQTFKNISSFSSLSLNYNVEFKDTVVFYAFGKIIIQVPSFIRAFFPFYCSYMRSENETWIVSLIGTNFKKYDYTNIYSDGILPSSVDFSVGYISLMGNLTFSGLYLSQNLVGGKTITKMGPFYEDTMHFIEVDFDFAEQRSSGFDNKTLFSSFGKKYPNCSFVNDTPTDIVVKVIPPNNPHYEKYCEFLKGIGTRSNNSIVMTNWNEYATEIKLRAGETLTMPDTNNVFHIEADMSGDDDEDGLSNEEEIFLYCTDPANSDTDSDGLEDGVEVSDQTIILQITDNCKTNEINTIPNWHDTDDDGISDGDEVLGRHPYVFDSVTNFFVTDPTSPDTDEDGLTDDVDAHPLDPCNNSDATSINNDWMNYWSSIAQKAGMSFLDLNDPSEDSDGDGIDNLTEMKNKTNPIFTNGFRKVVFEPSEIHFSLGEGESYTNIFYLNVFSSDTLTGAVYVSEIDWKPLLDMEGLSVYWEDCPLDQNNAKMITFSAKYFKRLKFTLLLNYSDMNYSVRDQEIKVIDSIGNFDETLNLIWDSSSGGVVNEAPTKPILLEPINGADVVLELHEITETNQVYEQVNFAWLPAIDPENETVSHHIYLYDSSFDLVFDNVVDGTNKLLSTEFVHFERGYYYWQVVATDLHENSRSSDTGNFFVFISGDEDRDGVDDNYEIKRGYDPFDPNDYPLTVLSPDNLDDGIVGRKYFYRLKADCGRRKKYVWQASDENALPPGIYLNPAGELRGTPISEGDYQFKVSAFDGKDIFSKTLRIKVLPKRDGLILRLGKGLLKQR